MLQEKTKKRLSNCRNQIGENVAVSITEKCIKKKTKQNHTQTRKIWETRVRNEDETQRN